MELRSRKCSINLNKKLKGFPQISCTLYVCTITKEVLNTDMFTLV